jgi:hypothetical protein
MKSLFATKKFRESALSVKSGDYRKVVLFQTFVIGIGLTVMPYLRLLGISGMFHHVLYALFLMLSGLYIFYLWNLLKNLTSNTLLIKGIFYFLLFTFLLALCTENPFYRIVHAHERPLCLFVIHFFLLLIEFTVILYVMKDVFSGKVFSASKLWGSACIYLMIALFFASIFELIHTLHLGSFGTEIRSGFPAFSESVHYSISNLIKLEDHYPHAIDVFKKIKVVESAWGDLFIALLVGNLLNKG